MARRPVAAIAAVVLMCEAVVLAWLNWFLGLVVDDQNMSLAGVAPRTMTLSAWVAGVLIGGYLLLCGAILLRTALRDRAPAGFARVLLISCAVVHCVLGAFSVGLAGWYVFAALMATFALLVFTLVSYGNGPRPVRKPPEEDRGGGPAATGGLTPTAG